ncbi:EthD domain-containing protein [Streptomyces neyagawaensis]|uniref:EthD domain-containing protein n=1 Tax=Streptomyces neyagawaensis TaxID=42238 RepID=UPI0006E22556|nr:EthD domain-containing protein [Streptomyces neyagawaensis]MCL6733498.1 EthD domain-containing protein [Streptomyces neyagawaensis]MDE1685311.1 EthD domain-containing protein [Streptomyces neyagawaensis]
MIKLVAAVRRRPGMTHAEYADYVREVHGGIALANKLTVVKYVQNHVFDSAYGAIGDTGYQVTLPRDSVTELYFENFETMAQTFADPYTRDVVGPDGVNFSDLPAALSLLVEEKPMEVPQPGPGAVKVLYFLKAAEGLEPEVFRQSWLRAHEDVLADPSGPARYLRGCEWNPALSGGGMVEYFGGSGQPAYEAYAALSFDDGEAVAGIRAYEEALRGHAEKHGAFHQPSLSFFLLTREIVVFDDTRTEGGAPA